MDVSSRRVRRTKARRSVTSTICDDRGPTYIFRWRVAADEWGRSIDCAEALHINSPDGKKRLNFVPPPVQNPLGHCMHAFTNVAIDQDERAVQECLASRGMV